MPIGGNAERQLRNTLGNEVGGELFEAVQTLQEDLDALELSAGGFEAQEAPAALTDNTGGTGNDTLVAVGGSVTLTDNTGSSGTHDDTLADGLTLTTLTDSTGGTADGTLVTLSTLTDSPADADALRDNLNATWHVEIENNFADIAAKINTALTDLTVQNQNDSDLAQKIIELVADNVNIRNNLADLAAKVNAFRTSLIAAGVFTA